MEADPGNRDVENLETTVFLHHRSEGKASIIDDYCKEAIRQGKEECLWICAPRGRTRLAKDIVPPTKGQNFQLHHLAKCYGWWKRWSLYSAIGVKDVEIVFTRVAWNRQIDVLTMPIDRDKALIDLDERIEKLREGVKDHESCGIDVNGVIHPDNQRCPNECWDELDGTYCPVKRIVQLKLEKQRVRCVEQMLQFFWETKSPTNCLDYLRSNGFLSTYRGLEKDTYYDALAPYGKSVKALWIVEGWHTKYLVFLIASGVASSITVVATTTVVTHSIDSGLSAGSYTIGLATLALALLSFLSAIF